ncbi:thiamine biosynthesis lipoprotein ApbE [Clostridium aceticum]|uniref:FAD:protein FMN transferase n=1 Tax=Clostridium aceticum TaxID=84022 RepID=A0A0G3W8F3_9CLOT|nr:FAD:protein FMN transferase [Clostridium aceticum]AKL94140.1 thiamine biosynthesis lipoprotein ApbE [Clostridium aceticum]
MLVVLLLLSLFLTSCKDQTPQLVREQQFVLGTFGQIHAYSTSTKEGNEALTKAYQRIHEIENMMSVAIQDSDVDLINRSAGLQPVEVSEETLKVIQEGLAYYEVTEGAFNIGLGRLIDLWGISIESTANPTTRPPSEEEIQAAKSHIDLQQLEIKNGEVFVKDADMRVDLGGIAKGYAVDEAAKTLREAGIESGFVNLGGDIYVLGPKPDGSLWKMGVQNPEVGSTNVIIKIELANRSIVSSGDYQRYFIDEETNQRYHHILDPKTGYPTDNELTSVTIISNSAIEGDVWSTAVFIMGLEKGLETLETLPDVEGILVTKDKTVYTTSGIGSEIELLDTSFTLAD